ncbi:MAG: hypothetical protein PVI21_00445 [Candidatus Woesebacteria bacterium]|jgi:hypothetical protein
MPIKNSFKKDLKKFVPKTKLGWFFAACGVVVVGLIIYSIISLVTAHKIFTKSQALEYLQQQSKAIQLPGELVYEGIEDGGCDTKGLFKGAYCTYTLKKYYKNSGDKDSGLNQAIEALERGVRKI